MTHRVVITGVGAVTAAGHDASATWARLAAGDSAIGPRTVTRAGLSGTWPMAPVTDWDPRRHFSAPEALLLDPFAQYAVVAAREAMATAGWRGPLPEADDTGVVLGTGGGGEGSREEAAAALFADRRERLHPMLVPRSNSQAAVGAIAQAWGCRGPSFVVSTGCASGTHAIAQAAALIRHGEARRVITGGSEASLILGVLRAFEAVRVLAPDTCRPFDAERRGMVLGEGAGILILERRDDALRRGARILAELAGWGLSSDAFDAVRPHPEGAVLAMRRALSAAGLEPSDVGYVNAHGTGTAANDAAEARAIREVFGDHADTLPVSATKSVHGHALGATGAIEAVATVLALRHRVVPPTANATRTGADCPIRQVTSRDVPIEAPVALSNSFAFGGLNATLVLRVDGDPT